MGYRKWQKRESGGQYLPETEAAARQAYDAVGVKNPRKEISYGGDS